MVTSLNGVGLDIIYTVSLERVDQKQREAIMELTFNPPETKRSLLLVFKDPSEYPPSLQPH